MKCRSAWPDWSTIASLSTAAGTLILAVATFSSVRSSQRAARVAERSLLLGLRPVLVPSRPEDPPEEVRFADGRSVSVHGGEAGVAEQSGASEESGTNGEGGARQESGTNGEEGARQESGTNGEEGNLYMVIPLRNAGSGLAVLHGWHVRVREPAADSQLEPAALEEFRRQQLDVYVAAGDRGFWQGAVREADDPFRSAPRRWARARDPTSSWTCSMATTREGSARSAAFS